MEFTRVDGIDAPAGIPSSVAERIAEVVATAVNEAGTYDEPLLYVPFDLDAQLSGVYDHRTDYLDLLYVAGDPVAVKVTVFPESDAWGTDPATADDKGRSRLTFYTGDLKEVLS